MGGWRFPVLRYWNSFTCFTCDNNYGIILTMPCNDKCNDVMTWKRNNLPLLDLEVRTWRFSLLQSAIGLYFLGPPVNNNSYIVFHALIIFKKLRFLSLKTIKGFSKRINRLACVKAVNTLETYHKSFWFGTSSPILWFPSSSQTKTIYKAYFFLSATTFLLQNWKFTTRTLRTGTNNGGRLASRKQNVEMRTLEGRTSSPRSEKSEEG